MISAAVRYIKGLQVLRDAFAERGGVIFGDGFSQRDMRRRGFTERAPQRLHPGRIGQGLEDQA